MTTSSKVRCALYAVIALVALVATWSQNLSYLGSDRPFMSAFVTDLMVNAASRSFTFDLLLLGAAVIVLMLTEARRHGIPHVWAYLVGGMLIAISVTFPLFLIARELRIARTGTVRPVATV